MDKSESARDGTKTKKLQKFEQFVKSINKLNNWFIGFMHRKENIEKEATMLEAVKKSSWNLNYHSVSGWWWQHTHCRNTFI